MKMPSSTNVKVEAKPTTVLEDAAKQCINCLEKKVRNLEKRKSRIEINKEKARKGTKLEKEQESSLTQYEQVTHDLEFARELHKQFLSISSEHEKMLKKQAKREKIAQQSAEIKRIGEILRLQSTLDQLGGNEVREDFKTGKHGAVVLTGDNLDNLDKLYQAISPSREESGADYAQQLNTAAEHLVNILDGKDRSVLGTTYKELKELLNLINNCGYFERTNEVVKEGEEAVKEEEEEEEEEEIEEETPEPEESPVETPLSSQQESLEGSPEPQQQPIDLTVANSDGVQPEIEMAPQQPMNTIEQDAFFAPSSTNAFPEESGANYAASYGNSQTMPQDFESFTNNRPFQFIQASYVMSDAEANAPAVVDPAVIIAQPAFISQGRFENQPQPTMQQPAQSVQPSQTMGEIPQVGQGDSIPQKPAPQSTPPTQQPSSGFPQANLQQNMQSGLYNAAANVGQQREDSSASPFDIPPSIPMPPSQSQGGSGQSASVAVPPPSVSVPGSDVQTGQASGDFNNTVSANVDYQQGYQSGGFNNYRGGRGGFRRGGGPSNNRNNGGGPGQMQNGFSSRGSSNQNNSRGNRGGGFNQGYQTGYNRQDNFQGQGNYNGGGFNKFNNRGGMNNGAPSNGFQRGGGQGGNGGRGTGGMRSMAQRGGNGGTKGTGSRGGFNRTPINQ